MARRIPGMRYALRLAVLAVGLSGLGGTLHAQSMEVAQEKVKAGDLSGAVQAVDRTLVRRDYTPTSRERYELLMLKGDTLVQLKQQRPALNAYTDAANDAPDTATMLQAMANAQLVGRSPGAMYRPRRSADASPVDITTPEGRKEGMVKLAGDMRGDVQRQYSAAIQGNDLDAMENAFRAMVNLYSVELASGMDPTAAKDAMQKLADRVYDSSTAVLTEMRARIQGMTLSAHTYDGYGYGDGPRGLTSKDRRELRGVLDDLGAMQERLVMYRRTARNLQERPERWEQLILEATELRARGSGLAESRF